MSLKELYKGTKFIETIENYALSEDVKSLNEDILNNESFWFYNDEGFWRNIIADPIKYWNQKIDLYNFVVSDWIARIPGLYWTPSSEQIRQHKNEDVALRSKQWIEFYPPGKSKKVMGGVGTLLLPQTDEGKILLSVSAGCNASTGIPLLCFPEVYDQLKIKQGDCVMIRGAKWQPMDMHWASKFASTKDIPRGYLVIDSIDKIQILEKNYPVTYHPLAKNIGLNVSLLEEGSAVNMSSQLIDLCIKRGIVENLLDRIILEYPKIFN